MVERPEDFGPLLARIPRWASPYRQLKRHGAAEVCAASIEAAGDGGSRQVDHIRGRVLGGRSIGHGNLRVPEQRVDLLRDRLRFRPLRRRDECADVHLRLFVVHVLASDSGDGSGGSCGDSFAQVRRRPRVRAKAALRPIRCPPQDRRVFFGCGGFASSSRYSGAISWMTRSRAMPMHDSTVQIAASPLWMA